MYSCICDCLRCCTVLSRCGLILIWLQCVEMMYVIVTEPEAPRHTGLQAFDSMTIVKMNRDWITPVLHSSPNLFETHTQMHTHTH